MRNVCVMGAPTPLRGEPTLSLWCFSIKKRQAFVCQRGMFSWWILTCG